MHTTEGHKMTPENAAGPEGFYGLPQGPVSSSKVGGNDLTAGETAPVRPNGMLTVEEVTAKEIDPNQWAFDRGLEST